MERKIRIEDKSTQSPLECILEHVYWNFIAYIWYKNLLFIPLDNYPIEKSKIILWMCILGVSCVGIIIRWKKCMTGRGNVADVMIGYGVYTVIAYYVYYTQWIRIVFIMFFIFFVAYASLVFTRKVRGKKLSQIRNKERRILIIKNRILRILNVSGLVLGMAMTILIVPMTYNRIENGGILAADSKDNDYTVGFDINYTENEASLAYNIDTIAKIRSNKTWFPLSEKEKLQVLQAICNCEANYWGMEDRIMVVMDDLEEGEVGTYYDSERRIVIDKQHLEKDDAIEVLDTVLHEMYHAWQHCLVRLYLDSSESQRKMRVFMHCEEYLNEMKNYQNSGDSHEEFMEYYGQLIEQDSREYAEDTKRIYYYQIDNILKEKEESQFNDNLISEQEEENTGSKNEVGAWDD